MVLTQVVKKVIGSLGSVTNFFMTDGILWLTEDVVGILNPVTMPVEEPIMDYYYLAGMVRHLTVILADFVDVFVVGLDGFPQKDFVLFSTVGYLNHGVSVRVAVINCIMVVYGADFTDKKTPVSIGTVRHGDFSKVL